jgi:hypothetical protein
LIAGLLSVGVAIAATPVGSEWMTHIPDLTDWIALQLRGLTS